MTVLHVINYSVLNMLPSKSDLCVCSCHFKFPEGTVSAKLSWQSRPKVDNSVHPCGYSGIGTRFFEQPIDHNIVGKLMLIPRHSDRPTGDHAPPSIMWDGSKTRWAGIIRCAGEIFTFVKLKSHVWENITFDVDKQIYIYIFIYCIKCCKYI